MRVALGIPVTPTPTPTPTCSPQANTLVINTSGASIGGSGNRDLVGMTVANTSSSCILVIDKITTTWNNSRNINSIVINGITVWTGSASSGTQLDIQDYTLNPNSGTIPITRFGFSGNMKNTTFNITFIMKDVSSKSTGNFSP
ncbi:hypothetical protein KKD04_01070 [Patescibacteria group bacterium]|nr:hypothetical protein [Patescibacteria group bacterium]